MKKLPEGNFALSIAHPGHELRLHGFLEQAKPFIFVLTDGGDPKKINSMNNYLGYIYRHTHVIGNTEKARDVLYIMEYTKDEKGKKYLTDEEINIEIQNGSVDFFELYIKKMANLFIFNKVDHVVMDAAEGFFAVHDICHIMTKLAVQLVEKITGKKITMFEFNTYARVEQGMNEDCTLIELGVEAQDEKMKHIIQYHPTVFEELKQNLPVNMELVNEFLQMQGGYENIKDILLTLNADFFYYEALRPVAEEEVYSDDITKHLLPLRTKLQEKLKLTEKTSV